MKNLQELKNEFIKRAENSKLVVDCAMDGTFFSDKVIVAEAPGEREVIQKLPLVGASGGLLWRTLHKRTGLSRKDFYITNVVKHQLIEKKSSGESARKEITKNELALWFELLVWELGHLPNLRYVVVMGNLALQAVAKRSGITSWRGSVLDVDLPDHSCGGVRSVRVICLNNAAAVIREPKLEVTFNMDVARIKRVLDGTHAPTEVSTTLYPSIGQIDKFVEDAQRSGDVIGTDIETIGGATACVGFADTPTTALCIAFRTKTDQVYSVQEEVHIWRKLQTLFKSSTKFIAQNGMFDVTWLWYQDKLLIPRLYFDTMLAHHTLYPQLPHNLGFLTTQYTDNPYYKDEKSGWREGGDIDTFWNYNGKDCAHLLSIWKRQEAELADQNLSDFFFQHVMRLQHHLARMTVGGIKVDTEMKEALKDELELRVADLLRKFQSLARDAVGEDIYYNPASPKQMSELYFSKLKLVGRGVSTDAENRERMFKHPRTTEVARQILSVHNEWATEAKFYGTYAKMGIDPDGRVRSTYNQTGTQSAPGRLSSSQTLWGSGGNLQNQPDRAHPMYIADEGYGFAYFDLSQAEARYVGWAAKIEKWIEQFERARIDSKYDAHRALAADLFKLPYDQVPTYDRYDTTKGHVLPEGKVNGDVTVRYVAKRCRHGLNYRMGPDRLATTAQLSLLEADSAYRVYHRETPELRVWWADLERELRTNGCLYNAYGRRYTVLERLSPEALEAIVAFKPQSTIGDKVCRVIYMCEDHPKWPRRARVALNIHDALIVLAPLDELKTCLSIMKYYAEEPLYIHGRELIIPAECKISTPDEKGIHRWSQLKTIEIEAVSTRSSGTNNSSTTPDVITTTPINTIS